ATRIRMGTASEAARKAARTRKRRRTRRYRTPSLRLLRRALLYALPLGDCERLDIPIACALASSSSSVDSRAVARMGTDPSRASLRLARPVPAHRQPPGRVWPRRCALRLLLPRGALSSDAAPGNRPETTLVVRSGGGGARDFPVQLHSPGVDR